MQPAYEVTESTQQMFYRVAGQTIVIAAQDDWAVTIIRELFKGWYLTPAVSSKEELLPAIVINSSMAPPAVPHAWTNFEIAGGGQCFTEADTSYIEIEGSVVAIGRPGRADVEIWTNGELEIQSSTLTRVVTYALSAALRRRCLFELHSGAVISPESGRGVLIIGPSGSGKSTLTVQLTAAGWPFLTDDVLLLSLAGAQVNAWALRRGFAITSRTLAASSFLQASGSLEHLKSAGLTADKKLFSPHQVFNSEFREHCVPETLFFTQLSGSDSSQVSRLSSAETMARLIRISPWSCYDRGTATKHLAVLSALARQSTGYSLRAGEDLLDPVRAANLIAVHTRD